VSRALAVVLVVVCFLAASIPPVGAAESSATRIDYVPPVGAPIIDGFRPPDEIWQAGNRGIDFGTLAGDAVMAAAAGRVVFAGPVGGALHVTIEHGDGLRTTYSFLEELSVRRGGVIGVGDVVGIAGGAFHFGVRAPDGTYLDPVALLDGRLHPRVVLIPGIDQGLDALDERERQSLWSTLVDNGAAALEFARETGSSWQKLVAHYAMEFDPVTHVARAASAFEQWRIQQGNCTPTSASIPIRSEQRVAVLVSGLGTGSGSNSAWEIDTGTLGYDSTDVVRFSYAGGRAPDDSNPARAALSPTLVTAFDAIDSQQSIDDSAARLADLLESVAAARPGIPIDVLAHSQGGIVARLAIGRSEAGGHLPEGVENLVTIGTPHGGAPLATGIETLRTVPGGDAPLAIIRSSGAADELDDRHPAISQLSETSAIIAEIRDRPMPDQVRFVSLGAAGDLVVPGTVTADSAAESHRILPSSIGAQAHGDLASDPRTTREIGLAVAGMPLGCQSLGEAARSYLTAESVRVAESAMSAMGAGIALSPALQVGAAIRSGE
jgi:pimeloyl-ACP methyl ester carboxylesterase